MTPPTDPAGTPAPEEVAHLEDATERLVEQVSALSAALQTIGQLQAQQIELANQVKAVKEDVAENAVPKHEFIQARKDAAVAVVAARQKLQTRIRVFAIGISCLALAGSGVASYVAIHVARNQRIAVCQERNREAKTNASKTKTYFAPYIAQEQHNPNGDPVLKALLVAISSTPPQLLKCQ